MTLKGLCNALSRRPGALDVIMLFSTPEYLLRPLCETLDNWQVHEDQGLPKFAQPHRIVQLTIAKGKTSPYMTNLAASCCLLY